MRLTFQKRMIPFQHKNTRTPLLSSRREFPGKIPRAYFLTLMLAAVFSCVASFADAGGAVSDQGKLAIDGYKSFSNDSISIGYPPAEQELVDGILQGYTFPLKLWDSKGLEAQLARWKKHDLPLIAKYLALEKPTEAMAGTFDEFRAQLAPIVEQEFGAINIYYFEDIKLALQRGVKINGFSYNAQGDTLGVSNFITMQRSAPAAGGADAAPENRTVRVLPIVFNKEIAGDRLAKEKQINATLRDMRWRLDESIYNFYCSRLYNIAAPEVLGCVSKAQRRLWPMDGLTNAIPVLVMRSHYPELGFAQLLQMHGAPPADFKKLAPEIDLERGPIAANPETAKALTDTYHYLSMLVVLDAIEEHGDEWLPQFFEGMRRENSLFLTADTACKVFTAITGKDLRDHATRVRERIAAKQ